MKDQTDLEEKICMYNEAYREGNPIVSDKRYDEVTQELAEKYPNSYLLKKGIVENQPIERKEPLPIKMMSLDKEKSIDGIINWLNKKGVGDNELIVITPKFDGISLVDHKNKCWTRGDGVVGQNSTEHFTKINALKLSQSNGIYFGEAIMKKKVFDLKYSDDFKSPRNLVAGLFNSKKSTEPLLDVDYIRYGIDSSLDKLNQIKTLNEINIVQCKTGTIRFSKLKTMDIQDFTDLYESWGSEYAIDGLVFDINDSQLRESLGREENGNPAYARALKLPEWSTDYKTKITGHKFSISKQGKLKGTVQFPTINIDGVEVTQATFYNAKFLFDWGLAEGREIEIKRSGDVIPKIVSVEGIHVPLKEEFKTNKEYEAAYELATDEILLKCSEDENVANLSDDLVECPCCGEQLVWDMNMVELVCTNENCKDIRIAKLVHFFKTLEFEDFGEESIKQLYENGFDTIQKLLDMGVWQIENIDGWGKVSGMKLAKQLRSLKEVGVPFAKLLTALDIFDGVLGEKDCQNILDNISNEDMKDVMDGQRIVLSELVKINGVGGVTALKFYQSMFEYFDGHLITLPIKVTYTQTPKQAVLSNKCTGWSVCMTGFRSDKITAYIEANGGKIVSGVSSKTTHLIVKDINSNSPKMVKAKSLGCEVITKEEFETKYL